MGEYYLAPSLVQLRNELNAAFPNRDRASDGWIGNASHQATVSDHNPDYAHGGVVRATDTDRDGIDPFALLDLAIRDFRVEYVIFNKFIYSRNYGFAKRDYHGVNDHTHHVHISIRHGEIYENDTQSWGIGTTVAPAPQPPGSNTSAQAAPAFPLKPGQYFGPKLPLSNAKSVSGYYSHREDLRAWQSRMISRGWSFGKYGADGYYGDATAKVAREFQAEKHLSVDGLIGNDTWSAAWTSSVT